MINNPKRYHYLDAVKGSAMFGIVSQHTIVGMDDPFNLWLATIKIVSFFMVSGMLLAIKPSSLSFKEYLLHKFYQLMIPYFIFSTLIILSDFLLTNFSFTVLAKDTINTIIFRGIGAIWFLPVFYFGSLIFFLIKNKSNIIILGDSLIFLLLSFGVSKCFSFLDGKSGIIMIILSRFILVIGKSFLAATYISWGYLFYSKILVKKSSLLIGLTLTVLSIISSQYCKGLDLNFLNFSEQPIIFVLTSTIATMGITFIFKALESSFSINYRFLSFLSINSLLIMCTHYYFNIIPFANFVSSSLAGFPKYIVAIGTVLLIETIIIEIVNHTKLKKILFV